MGGVAVQELENKAGQRSSPLTEETMTHSFDELLAVIADDSAREFDLAEADIFVHLLCVFSIERTPPAAHLEKQHAYCGEGQR